MILMTAGCASENGTKEKQASVRASVDPNASLYDRLGGEVGITRVTEDFLEGLSNDPRIDLQRKNSAHPWEPTPANQMILKVRAVALMSKVTGGPDYYAAVGGRDMVTTHRGMNVTEAEWNAGVELFKQSLNECDVPRREQEELLALVGGLRNQIVGK